MTKVENPGVSIIVPNYDDGSNLERLLSSFADNNSYHPFEFIIVSHKSHSNTESIVKKWTGKLFIKHIKRDIVYSQASSNNLAASKAVYPNLLFMSNRIVYTEDVLPLALAQLQDDNIGVVGIRLDNWISNLQHDKEPTVHNLGVKLYWDEKKRYFCPYQIRLDSIEKAKKIGSCFYPAVNGAFMLCRNTDFLALGGFFEGYRYCYEDVDFCLQLNIKLGKKSLCINDGSLQLNVYVRKNRVELKANTSRSVSKDTIFFNLRNDEYFKRLEGLAITIHPKRIKGYIDSIRNGVISGWACNLDNYEEKVIIDILIDGKNVGSTEASLKRDDSAEKGVGDGCHGFRHHIPNKYLDGKVHKVSIAYTKDYKQKIIRESTVDVKLDLKHSHENRKPVLSHSIKKFQGAISYREGAPTVLLCAHKVNKNDQYGAEISLLDVLDSFYEMGFNVLVTIPNEDNIAYIENIKQKSFFVLSFKYGWWLQGVPVNDDIIETFSKVINDYNVDAVHVNTIMIREPLVAAKRMNIPGVIHAREIISSDVQLSDKIGETPSKNISRVLSSSDFIIANSKATANCYPKEKATYVVPNAIDTELFDIENELKTDGINVALISNNLPKKGIYDFIEIARKADTKVPNAKFLLIGSENYHIAKFKKSQQDGELPKNIIFTGYIEGALNAVAKSNIVLNLSHVQESFGRTVLEAMAARRPVISYDWGALPELVWDGKNGYLIPFGDIALAFDRIAYLCNNQDKILTMGEAGRQIAAKNFSKEKQAEHLKESYDDIFKKWQEEKNYILGAKKHLTVQATNLVNNLKSNYNLADGNLMTGKGNREGVFQRNAKQFDIKKSPRDDTKQFQTSNKKDNKKQNEFARDVKRLRIMLLELGFTDRAYNELIGLAKDGKKPVLQEYAAWELALWHANKYTIEDAHKCLHFLSIVKQNAYNKHPSNQVVIIEAECYDLLGDFDNGKKIIKEALNINPSADLYLAAANMESSISKRINYINKALDVAGTSNISFDYNKECEHYDAICSGSDVKKLVQADHYPKVTVIMPVYNAEKTIQTALESISAQTWNNMEIIVVDDCSTDNTLQVVQEFAHKDSRVLVLKAKENKGPYIARNMALQVATGEYVTCCDADDWSHPEKIEAQAQHLNNNPNIIANASQWVRAKNNLRFYRRGNPGYYIQLNVSSLMFRRKRLMDALGYWDSVRFGADTELIQRIKTVFGDQAIHEIPNKLLSFARAAEHSLTESEKFGYPGYIMGARKEYRDSYLYYYSVNSKLKYHYPQGNRPFTVPAIMWTEQVNLLNSSRHFDTILVSDFRISTNVELVIKEIEVRKKCGNRIGLVQMARYDVNPGAKIDSKLRDIIEGNVVQMLVYGEIASGDNLIVIDPIVLNEKQLYIPNIAIESVSVIINQPLKPDRKTDYFHYDFSRCEKHLREYFFKEAVWYPLDSKIRASLKQLSSTHYSKIELSDLDWIEVSKQNHKH